MATGPEHYRAAEFAFENAKDEDGGSNKERFFLAAAQFHATMALAAATALNDADGGTSPEDYRAWRRVASVELTAEQAGHNAESEVGR